ncbi:unnamed protein product [Aphanomyces euteiches]
MDPPAKKRKTQVRFDAETDLDLVKEVLAHNPYDKEFGNKRALREEEDRKATKKKHDIMLRTSDHDEGAAIREEAMKTVGDRKPHNNLQTTMIAYMSERDVKSRELEERRLTLEERRLEIEERKAAHEAERFALEKQERLALINLLSKFASQNGS